MNSEKAPPQDLVLDLASFQLIRAGQRVKLEKTPMEILALLVRKRGVLITREEIVRAIWADGVHVDVDAGINTAIRKIRLALDDNSASPHYVETVIGKGYRFVGPIAVIENESALPVPSGPSTRLSRRIKMTLLPAGAAAALILVLFAVHRLTPMLHGGAGEPAMMESYLRGRFELTLLNVPIPDTARSHFERAIALDPRYAPAYAGLADFYRSRAISDDDGADRAWQLAEQYANQALSLNNENAETHAAVAQITLTHDWDWSAARAHALRALELNPNLPEAHAVYARYLRTAGNTYAAVSQRQQAVALDPDRMDLRAELAMEYFFARDYQSAVASARQLLAHEAYRRFAHSVLCENLGRLKRFDESVNECRQWLALDGHADWIPAYFREYREDGFDAARLFLARKELNDVLKRPQPDLWDLANAYVLAGRRDEALRTLFEGLKMHEPGLLQLRVDPDFDSIRSDPRYTELLRQIKFPTN